MSINELIQKQNELAHQMRTMHAEAVEADRGFTPEERSKWDAIDADRSALEQRIDDAKKAEGLKDVEPRSLPHATEKQQHSEKKSDHADAFRALLRSTSDGLAGLSAEHRELILEKRAITSATNAAGGYTVSTSFGDRIIESLKSYGGINLVGTTLVTETGDPLPFPTNDDTANAGAAMNSNQTTAATETDLTFGQKTLNADFYGSGIVRASYALLQDAAVDIESYLSKQLAKRIGRAEAGAHATALMAAATSVGTAASPTALTYADLLKLEHGVDPEYRALGATWVMNDLTLKLIKSILDADGRPLWVPSIAGAVPTEIMGYKYVIDQGINSGAAPATGNSVIAFGDMSEFYIRRVKEISLVRLVERYAEFFQVGFLAHSRMDSDLLDTAAVKKLVMQ